jgi:hypothetical protein
MVWVWRALAWLIRARLVVTLVKVSREGDAPTQAFSIATFNLCRGKMTADPHAYTIQGPNTSGNPVPVYSAALGAPGSLQAAVHGSQVGGNQQNTATLAAAAGKTTYISGLLLVVGGATNGLAVAVTIIGLLGGTMSIAVEAQTGATTQPQTIQIPFNPPLPGAGPNTAIAVVLPALGQGNVTASVAAWGFQQ